MKNMKKITGLVLAAAMVAGLFSGFSVKAAEETNLALNKTATASSTANNCGPEIAVNGVKDQPNQWNSANMKNGTVADTAEQTHQWLQVDLGESGAQISQIKLWYNLRVWPMVYRVETTDTPDVADSWETVVSVSRPSSSAGNGWVQNGDGQNIADNAANTDTITTTSVPALEMTELSRYVRFYVEKVNAQAPGNNVNLREIEIFGTFEEETQKVYEVFPDVKQDAWYEEAVQYVYDNGIMSGSKGLFNPTGKVTRAQVVTTLYNLEGAPEVTDFSVCNRFTDVDQSAWYAAAVSWACREGVANGNTTTAKFAPNDNVTRQQLATFFYNYAEYKNLDIETREDISNMTGAEEVSSYALETIQWAVGTGLISGSETTGEDGTAVYNLNPRGTATRAQLASVIQRFCEANDL